MSNDTSDDVMDVNEILKPLGISSLERKVVLPLYIGQTTDPIQRIGIQHQTGHEVISSDGTTFKTANNQGYDNCHWCIGGSER